MKRKRLKKERFVLIVCFALLIISVVYSLICAACQSNIGILNAAFDEEKWAELIFNLFTIQATIATLSISIIAIITGFQSKSVYGITVTHYVTSLKPCMFKHKVLMIADLVITGANYFCVAYKWFNVSIALFAISIIISCVLIWDTSFVFKQSNVISNEIASFLEENYNKDVLNRLETSVIENAVAENVIELNSELLFLLALYKKELTSPDCLSELLEQMEAILVNCFLNCYTSNNKEMVLTVLKSINDVYKTANENPQNNQVHAVSIWDGISFDYYSFISTINYAQLRSHHKLNYLDFKFQLEKNQVFELKDDKYVLINNFSLEYYYLQIYWRCAENNRLSEGELEIVKAQLIDAACVDVWGRTLSKHRAAVNINGLCYLIKAYIEDGEVNLLKQYFLQHYYLQPKKSLAYAFLVSFIYAYYLAYDEPLVEERKERKNALEYLAVLTKENNRRPSYLKKALQRMKLLDVLEAYGSQFFGLMRSWEKFENGVFKTMVLELTIKELLFFLCIKRYQNEETLAKCFRLISDYDVLSFIMKYFSENRLFDERFKSFNQKMYKGSISDKQLLMISDMVCGALKREYKEELTQKAEEHPINSENTKKLKERLNSLFYEQMGRFKMFSHTEFTNILTKSQSFELLIADYTDFEENNDTALQYAVTDCIYWQFFKCLGTHIRTNEVSYQSTDKQDRLIGLAAGLQTDTFIGSRETFCDEEDKDKLIRFTEAMHKIENPNDYNKLYLLNSHNMLFQITKVVFDTEEITTDDFDRLGVHVKGEEYYYNRLANVMKISYTKEELLSYLNKTMKRIRISYDLNYGFKEEIVGCSIDINYDWNIESDAPDENKEEETTEEKEQNQGMIKRINNLLKDVRNKL